MFLPLSLGVCVGFVTAFLVQAYHWPPWMLIALLLPYLRHQHRLSAVVAFMGAVGFILFAKAELHRSLPLSLDKASSLISVHLAELPQKPQPAVATKYTVVLNQAITLNGFTLAADSKIRLSDYAGLAMTVGEDWQLQVVLRSPRGLVNAAGFDFRRWLLSERILATGYMVADDRNIKLRKRGFSLLALRYQLAQTLDDTLHEKPSRALIKALVLGDTSEFTALHRRVLQQTGVAHLFVISGLHIGLLAMLAWWLGRGLSVLLWLPMRSAYATSVQACCALVGALLYAALAGFSLPTVRALIMVTVVLLASLPRRNYRPIHAVLMAAALVLIADPMAILGMSFWLSFTAVTVLMYAWQSQQRVKALMLSQLSIFMPMAIVLCVFGLPVSLLAPIVNLVAIPLLSLVLVPCCLLATVLLMFGWQAPFGLIQSVFDKLWDGLIYIAAYDGASITLQPTLLTVALAMAGLVIGFRYRRFWVIAIVAQLPLWFMPPKLEPQLRITVFDVGQGLAVLLQHQQYSVLYDTGAAYRSGFSMAEAVIEPSLFRFGINKLDALIISHGDNDHAGGAPIIIEAFKPDRVIVPEGLLQPNAKHRSCTRTSPLALGQLRLKFLSAGLEGASRNDRSCVVQLSFNGFSMLLTGDISKLAEFSILSDTSLASDVLLIPHHGSRSSSSNRFVEAIKPKLALVSAGFNNRFGHPHAEVLGIYAQHKVPVLNTATAGAIDIYVNESGKITSIRKARDTKFGFWH